MFLNYLFICHVIHIPLINKCPVSPVENKIIPPKNVKFKHNFFRFPVHFDHLTSGSIHIDSSTTGPDQNVVPVFLIYGR